MTMKKDRFISQQLMWFTMIILICGVIATGILTNITLRSIQKNIPIKLLAELNDLSLVLENLSEVVNAAENAKTQASAKNLSLLRNKVETVFRNIVELRESYVFDNLVQASAFHAVVAPAIADLKIWLSDGVSGFGPDTETTAAIVFLRIHEAFQKARSLNRTSKMKAQKILEEQRKRLDHFLFSVNLFFALTILVTFSMVYLLIRQYVLQKREATAQAELRNQRDLLNSLFENVMLGITVWDREGTLLLSNRGFSDITGYSMGDIKTLEDWFPRAYPDPEYRSKVLLDWKESSGQKSAIREFKVTCKNGEVKDIEFRGNFLSDGRALVTMLDITDRKRAEEVLRESETRFRAIFEKTAVGILLVDSKTRKYIRVNPAFQNISGYNTEELLSMSPSDITYPEDWPSEDNFLEELLARKCDQYQIEKRYVRKDGGTVWCRVTVSMVYDGSGRPEYTVSIVEDITDRKQAEEDQRRLETQLRQAHKLSLIHI